MFSMPSSFCAFSMPRSESATSRLPQVFRLVLKIIAEIIETEFVVGAVGDVGLVCFAAVAGTEKIMLNFETAKDISFVVEGLSFRSLGEGGVVYKRCFVIEDTHGHPERAIYL